ncbi:Cro/Cl family transcriptional regulator [Priestia filamentosa]|uniref:Cro/Cl family transcriptional regulator n=1 Tax=Priestia filamentosa TaxID=1402861 RepID=A0A0H4KUN5_9BACI|nr:helix-turn-helix transcriptional regulator [Priestia filamentosa]AKO92013.1 Cro/Cl family transcriptional regulator [Priestia filamentosa]
MKIMIDDLLKEKDRTRYWLAKEVRITYPNLCNLADRKTASIKFEIMERICTALECTPNELLGWNQRE